MNIMESIVRREAEMKVSAEEFFTSRAFKAYARETVKSVLKGRVKRIPELMLVHGGEDTGWTDSLRMMINTSNAIVRHYVNLIDQFMCALGVIFHECAHCLFMDFDAEDLANDQLAKGEFWPCIPEVESDDDEKSLEEMQLEMKKYGMPEVFRKIIHTIINVVRDYHDEACFKASHGTFEASCIDIARKANLAEALPLDVILPMKPSNMSLFMTLLLEYIFTDDFLAVDEKLKRHELCGVIEELRPLINEAKYTNDTAMMYDRVNRIMVRLWPYVKEELEHLDSEFSGVSGEHTEESMAGIMEEIEEAAKAAGHAHDAAAPAGMKTAEGAKSVMLDAGGSGDGGVYDAEDTENSEEPGEAEKALSELLKEIKTEKAETVVEQEVAEKVKTDSKEGLSETDQAKLIVERSMTIPDHAEEEYLELLKKVNQYSRVMQQRIRKILKNLNYDGVLRKNFGRIIKAKDSYRVDGKYFYKKQRPADLPDLAVAIIIDCSGSMRGEKMRLCKRAGVLLNDFCTGLKVPVMIAGHTNKEREMCCNFLVVVPFDRVTDKDKYRMMSLRAYGGNRDGLALKAGLNLLAKRPEKTRILFMISDGQPTDYDPVCEGEICKPSSMVAIEDIHEGLTFAERKKIQVIACGIDEDKELIKEIYGSDRFLDIENLEELPQTLVSIIRRNMLKFA